MNKILITGGAGFIGHHLAKRLISQGMEVIVFDNLLNFCFPPDSRYKEFLDARLLVLTAGVTFVKGDVRDKDALAKALRDFIPDVVIHLAAIPISRAANSCSEEAVQINVNGTVNLLEAIRFTKSVHRFVYVSSSCVYGDFIRTPADEEHPMNPIDVYGATKLSGEILTKGYGARFGIEYSIVRPSAVYGSGDSNRRVVQLMIENAIKGKPLVVHNGGASSLDFTHVEDTVSGIVLSIHHEAAKGETFNITRGEGRRISDLVAILKKRFPALRVTDTGQDERRPERGGLDISKACSLLGYAPKYSLETGIEEYVNTLLASDQSRLLR